MPLVTHLTTVMVRYPTCPVNRKYRGECFCWKSNCKKSTYLLTQWSFQTVQACRPPQHTRISNDAHKRHQNPRFLHQKWSQQLQLGGVPLFEIFLFEESRS